MSDSIAARTRVSRSAARPRAGSRSSSPATGFGYIKAGESLGLEGAPHALAVEQFVEKPDEETARQYVASGRYTWNAGMFVAPGIALFATSPGVRTSMTCTPCDCSSSTSCHWTVRVVPVRRLSAT